MAKRTNRPTPPAEVLEPVPTHQFVPAPEIIAWARESFVVAGAPIKNPDHAHLQAAHTCEVPV